MRLSERSYPHPVLGNKDDVEDVAFQVTFDVVPDKSNYYVTVTPQCSSSTLKKMINKGTAVYVLHVECSNTLFRRAYDFAASPHTVTIPANQLNAKVELNAMIRAKKDVPAYRIDNAHEDYGDARFDVKAGDILAVAEGQTFDADTTHDSLKKISSIMQVEESPKDGDHPMEVDPFSTNKIRILLCKQDFTRYKNLKHIPALSSHLTTTLVLPVLLQALHLVRDDESGVQHLGWYSNLKKRIEAIGLENESEDLIIAQHLLDMPIRRALSSAEQYGAVASD